jgi:hypothetical protein
MAIFKKGLWHSWEPMKIGTLSTFNRFERGPKTAFCYSSYIDPTCPRVSRGAAQYSDLFASTQHPARGVASLFYCPGEPKPMSSKQHRAGPTQLDGWLLVAAALEKHADALNRFRRAAHGLDRTERIEEIERRIALEDYALRRRQRA